VNVRGDDRMLKGEIAASNERSQSMRSEAEQTQPRISQPYQDLCKAEEGLQVLTEQPYRRSQSV
jgi:hypothetical protein